MDFKKVSEVSAVAIPVLMLASCIRLITYYARWDIPILDYITATELLLLFLWPILTIVALAALYLLLNLAFVMLVWLYVRFRGESEKKPAEVPTQPKGPVEHKPSGPLGYIVLGVALLGIFVTFFQGIWYDYDIAPLVIVHTGLWLAVVVTIQRVLGTPDELRVESFFIGTMITLLSASFFYGRYQAHYAITEPVIQTVTLTDGSMISTDTNVVFVGKTSGYYFYYKLAEKEALILPAAQIKSVRIKQAE